MFDWRNCYTRYINLDSRLDRNNHMKSELLKAGINAGRFSALKISEHNERAKTMKWRMNGGNVGCHYSQVQVMKDALENNEDAFIMEDDLVFCSDIQKRLDYINNFCNTHDWDVFFLGATFHANPTWHALRHINMPQCRCTLNRDYEITDDERILRTYGIWSTYAYIVNKNSIQKILDLFDKYLHESIGIDYLFIRIQPMINAFALIPGSIKQMDNKSDIGIGVTNFSGFSKLGEYWYQDNMENFEPKKLSEYADCIKLPLQKI